MVYEGHRIAKCAAWGLMARWDYPSERATARAVGRGREPNCHMSMGTGSMAAEALPRVYHNLATELCDR